MPELLEVGLESQQRMVGPSPVFLGVVAYPCPLHQPTVDHQNRGVQIEHHTASFVGQIEKHLPQEVVDLDNLPDVFWRQPLEKSPDCGLVGESAQTHDPLEGSVVLQDLRFVDSVHPRDDGIEDSHNHFGRMIVAVSRSRTEVALKQALEAQFLTKTLDQEHPCKMCQVRFLEGNFDFSQPFWHVTQMPPWGVFLSQTTLPFQQPCLPSVK